MPKNCIKNYKNHIQRTIINNYDDFVFSLIDSEVLDADGNYNYEKIKFYGNMFSNGLYNAIIKKEEFDADILMQNIVNCYDLNDDINLLILICFYYHMIRGFFPAHILVFAVDKRLLQYFMKVFTDNCRLKLRIK